VLRFLTGTLDNYHVQHVQTLFGANPASLLMDTTDGTFVVVRWGGRVAVWGSHTDDSRSSSA